YWPALAAPLRGRRLGQQPRHPPAHHPGPGLGGAVVFPGVLLAARSRLRPDRPGAEDTVPPGIRVVERDPRREVAEDRGADADPGERAAPPQARLFRADPAEPAGAVDPPGPRAVGPPPGPGGNLLSSCEVAL